MELMRMRNDQSRPRLSNRRLQCDTGERIAVDKKAGQENS